MKTFKTILISLLLLIIVVVIIGLVVVTGVQRGAIPKYKGELVIQGLGSDVTVYRDLRGMPHIYAANEHDLYFSVGYVMAQERLWFMDLIRRVTTGRLSEVMGKDLVQTDKFLRCLEMTTKSKILLSNEDPVILSYMQAYTDGVNAYIVAAGKKLPPEFRILGYKPDPWKLEDIANIIGYMGWDLAKDNLASDLFYYHLRQKFGVEKATQLIPDWNAVNSIVFPDFKLNETLLKDARAFISSMDTLEALGIASFSGSNNWAVTGKRSETGKPILSNDMHLSFGAPGIWMQIHQVIPGKLNVTGVVIPGEPFVVAGHNEKIAWGITNLMVDDIDLFAEKINPENGNQYYFNGGWKNMAVKREIIKIKGGKRDSVIIKYTHRGPIISGFRDVKDASLSMRWSGYDNSDEIRSVCLLNRAGSWDDFRSAINTFRSVSQNFVYADIEGNIGLSTGGGIAIRKGNGTIIRNGETDEYDWKGYVPFEQLPSSYNPDKGYVSSANNKTVIEGYPYYISSEFKLPYRINRIRQMLDEKEVFSIEDFKRMILDQHSDYAALLTPFILKLSDRKNDLTPVETSALASLTNWDYDMNAGLVAPSIFEFFRISFMKNLLADELGDLFDQMISKTGDFIIQMGDYYIYRILKTGPDEWVDNINTPQKETLDDIVLTSFKDCISSLSQQFGEDQAKWNWGSIHKITINHPLGSVKILDRIFRLNSDEYSIGGSDHTVSPYEYKADFKVYHGASERHIFNTANWDESLTVIPTGASGIPASEFYLSQTKAYLEGKFYKDAFSEGAVKAAAKYTLVLKPGK
ncbi:MAG: penicillin acylase family protein [Bacteroidia bacterium]|nr:penicillin acylase family protein [Bacteroidia bacterium]